MIPRKMCTEVQVQAYDDPNGTLIAVSRLPWVLLAMERAVFQVACVMSHSGSTTELSGGGWAAMGEAL